MSGGITIENLTIGHLMGSTVGIAASINTNTLGVELRDWWNSCGWFPTLDDVNGTFTSCGEGFASTTVVASS